MNEKTTNEKILFVDDDPNLLAGCERNFRRRFPLDTAEGGEAGLKKIATHGPYAVVIADRQMPGMDGIQFLSLVRQQAPNTVRIMMTGNADLESAIRVVNEGNIFRFLTKPCPPDVLGKSIEDGRAQYRLVMAEKELLNQTLKGSIKLLTDILSMMDNQSFGRAQLMRDVITNVTAKVSAANPWEIHLAVMLASIGYVTIPPETLIKARAGQTLSKAEEQILTRVPETAARLLSNIPRLEGVAQIVRYQHKRFDGTGLPADAVAGGAIPLGARLLKILGDMNELQSAGRSRLDVLREMEGRPGWYDPALMTTVRACFGGTAAAEAAVRETMAMTVSDLAPGMVLHADIVTKDGTPILFAGHPINDMALEKIRNFEFVSGIKEPVFVQMPESVG